MPPSVTDPVDIALKRRLVGSAEFDSGYDALDEALRLQFRTHYHIFGTKELKPAVATVLFNTSLSLYNRMVELETSKKDNEITTLVVKIVLNLLGILSYSLDHLDEAKTYLAKASKLEQNGHRDFDVFLNLENLYYQGLVLNDTHIYYQLLFENINCLPNESHGLVCQYLHMIIDKLDRKQSWQQLSKSFSQSQEDPLLCYIGMHVCVGDKEYSDKLIYSIGTSIANRTEFPHADESNNEQLEQFNIFLQYYFKRMPSNVTVSSKWREFIVMAMGKTFQSVAVAKAAMIYFAKCSKSNDIEMKKQNKLESILNFVNFNKYSARDFRLNNETHSNIVSLIDSYVYILRVADNADANIENMFDFQETTEKLLELLIKFYEENQLAFTHSDEALNWLESSPKLVLPEGVKETLSKAWTTLYHIRKDNLEYVTSLDLASYLASAMSLEQKGSAKLCELEFKYAYTLAQGRHVEAATRILKDQLLELYPECYKAWHLLALCESALHEDKEVPYKITASILEAMQEKLKKGSLSANDRWQYVHVKLTSISVIEAMFGTVEALDILPEAFELYSRLFSDQDGKYDNIGEYYSQTKEYLLQIIWVFAANMYMRVGGEENMRKAKECIQESMKSSSKFLNLNCNIAQGFYYLMQNTPKKALHEFETVLYYDETNLDAIIGFGEIIFPEDSTEDELDRQRKNYYKLFDSDTSNLGKNKDSNESIFVNSRDKSAAVARLKFILEFSVKKSSRCYFSHEIWWYLSIIYEKYKDRRYKAALLNCIRLKESEPIRNFKYCDY